MARQAACIIGASRGLGFGLVREYLGRGWDVVGTVRGAGATPLREVKDAALSVESVDINVPAQIAALRGRLNQRRFDLLFVNAGVADNAAETIGDVSDESFMHVLKTNALSPMRVIETLAPLVTSTGTIVAMSSGLGSVAGNDSGGYEVYRASKASLNTLMRSYAARAGGERSLLLMDPGWVRTDMGGRSAPLDVATSTRGIADTIALRAGKPGLQYLDYQGQIVRW
jgi:NAD(P)-dependent dehydrogenase (short-subunit alcohol dehydrogenase family)